MQKNNSFLSILWNKFAIYLSTLAGLFLSLLITLIVSHDLSIFERSGYGIATVTLMQILMVIQLGLPGAFNIIGSGVFRREFKKDLYYLYGSRVSFFIGSLIIFSYISDKTGLLIFFAITSGIFLIPAQWILNALQKDVSLEIFALLRLIPVIFQLFALLIVRILDHIQLNSYLLCWIFGNIINFLVLVIIVRMSALTQSQKATQYSFFDFKKLAIAGFIPHVSLQEILRFELILVPIIKSPLYAASFFIVIGISNWTKSICDSIAIVNFKSYRNDMNFSEKSLQIKKIHRQIVTIAFSGTLINVILFRFLLHFLPNVYHSIFWGVVPFTLGATFSAARRLYLDLLRIGGVATSRGASKIELYSFLPILIATSMLFFNLSLNTWACIWSIATFLGLLITIRRLTNYEN
jgi:hypothetical protein